MGFSGKDMKSSEFMDKQIRGLSRSHSDDFSEFSYSRGRDDDDGGGGDLSYEVGKDDSDSSFVFHPVRPVVSSRSNDSTFQNYYPMDYNDPMNAGSKKIGTFNGRALISVIDQKMEEHSNNLLHAVEGLSVRLCQLETRTRQIEHSVDELKESSEFNNKRAEAKLMELENILIEVQGGIQDLRDKQEISEVQLQLGKLQKTLYQPAEDKKTKTNARSVQGVLSSVQQEVNQLNPSSVTFPQQFPPHPNVPPIQSYQSLPPIPSAGQFPTQVYHNQIPSNSDFNYSPPMFSSAFSHQQHFMPPIQQPQPTSAAPHQPVPQLPLTSQLQQLPVQHPSCDAVDPQAFHSSTHRFEEISYMWPQSYNMSMQRTHNAPSLAPPSQQIPFGFNQRIYEQPSRSSEFHPEHMQPSKHSSFRDVYPQSGLPSQYSSSKMKPSELPPFSTVLGSETRFSQPPKSEVLPRALPMASNVDSGSSSDGIGKSIAVDDVIDNIVAMGFRRDIVRATVKKMTENGQSVDLNVVLDKLMNNGEVHPESGRFGR